MPLESDIVALALSEDIGPGDVTTRYFTDPTRQAEARVVAREPCIVAGLDIAEEVFHRVDPSLAVVKVVEDGAHLAAGGIAMQVSGRAASLLTAERTALNFLQRLSGVATLTGEFVVAVRGTSARILDTRKTTPGMRVLEKAAVRAGGGQNHRFGLHDMVMVKDNHLAAGAGLVELQAAISRLKAERPEVRVELEADTLDQVKKFLTLDGVDVILLDNMTPAELREAVALRKPGVAFEASGGVNLKTVRQIAETGVDFVSVGEMTHSARAVDLSLEISLEETLRGAGLHATKT
ncbi:MAG TPA: carboxylating nicotinate-nucleotide diphosphorylase [Terrimicrobiaceae bacterium]|nr:carboxylating nicotinate-nucleotide diphosphorylase [Terrimicrobiaceae bacterium]